MEVVAARAGAIAVEVHADRPAAAAVRTAALIRERRQIRLVDGRAGHVLRSAGKAAGKAAKGKKPKLSAECAVAIQHAIAAVVAGL